MPRTFWRSFAALAFVTSVAPALFSAEPEGDPPQRPVSVALGVKTGIIPPVLAVPELVFHLPHFFLGAFGITTRGGIGNGGKRLTMGIEAAYEIHPPERSTPYLAASYFRYETGADAAGFSERSDSVTFTAGYEWQAKHAELQLGAGALLVLTDERTVPPCSGLGCVDFELPLPMLLPAFDLALRFRF